MSIHDHCHWNCGGTECTAAERVWSTLSSKEIKQMAIEEIKGQPFFGEVKRR